MDYLDFVIKITGKTGEEFTVNVESPAGQGQSTLRLPYDPDDLVTILQALGATFRGGGASAQPATGDSPDGIVGRGERISVSVPKPTDVGLKLFEHLLTGEARALFNRSVGRVQENDELGLRLKLQLNLDDPEVARLARLPWELLYSKEEHEYLNLIGKYPVVRHLAISQPERSEAIYPPLRVLVVMSSPKGVVALDLEHEKKLIDENWADHDNVEVTYLEKPTLENLNRKVIENEYHVLHYMGHGDFDPESGQGVLIMEDDEGNPDPIPAHALSVVLRKAKKMRLIFLNACETAKAAETQGQDPFAGVATALVMANVGDVLAMQFPISDKAAIKFSQAFYWSIATGMPMDAAVSEGRSAIKLALPNSMEWATPVLFMRSETGVFFDIKEPAPPSPEPSPAPAPAPAPAPTSPAKKYALYAALAVVAVVAAYLLWPKAPPDLARLAWTHQESVSVDMDVPEATRATAPVQLGLVGCTQWGPSGCEAEDEIEGRATLERYNIAWSLDPDSSDIASIVGDSVSEFHHIARVAGLSRPGTVTLVARVSNANDIPALGKLIEVKVPEARRAAAGAAADQVLAKVGDAQVSFDALIGEAEAFLGQYPYALDETRAAQMETVLAESKRLKTLLDDAMQPGPDATVADEHRMLAEFVNGARALRPQGSPEIEAASARLGELTNYFNTMPVLSYAAIHNMDGIRPDPIETCRTAVTSGSFAGLCDRGTIQDEFQVGSKVWFSLQFVSKSRSGRYSVTIEGPGDPAPDTDTHSVDRRASFPSHRYNGFTPEQPGTYTIRVTNAADGRLVGLKTVQVG